MTRVLIAEDDKYLNKLLSDRLQLEGFDVSSVLDGESAWSTLENHRKEGKNFDVLVTDMLLPRMMGAELFTKINESAAHPHLRKIAISGIYKDPQSINEISRLHSLAAYLPKPFAFEKLLEFVSGSAASSDTRLRLSGTLSQSSLEKLFLEAYNQNFTGRLVLERADTRRRIYFSNGLPVGADSNSVTESLGRSLVTLGYISEELRDEASREMVQQRMQLGQMLVHMGAITQERLFEALRKHTYKLLLSSFLWREGKFVFEPMDELPSYIMPLEYNSMLLMLKAHQAIYHRDFIFSLFDTKQDLYCWREARAFQLLPLLNLDRQSEAFFVQLPKDKALRSIIENVPDKGRETVFRVFYLLESLGLMDFKSEVDSRNLDLPVTDFRSDFDGEKAIDVRTDQIQKEYMDLIHKNYFEIFGIQPNFEASELQESYRGIRFRLHPDRFGENLNGQSKRILDDMLARIDKAYQTLIDPAKRKSYAESTNQQKADSLADSKRFLDAQELFRDGQRLLSAQNFQAALAKFVEATQKWPRGIEYELYRYYCDFRLKAVGNPQSTEAQQALVRLKSLSDTNPHSDTGFLLVGRAYQAQGRVDLARLAFQNALHANEDCDEASNALAHIQEKQSKKMGFEKAVRKTKSYFRYFVLLGILGVAVGAYFVVQKLMQPDDPDVHELSVEDLQPIWPAVLARQKNDSAKITIRAGQLKEFPDSVLKSKCVQTLSKFQSRGILRLYIFDEKEGLSAQCQGETLKRYAPVKK